MNYFKCFQLDFDLFWNVNFYMVVFLFVAWQIDGGGLADGYTQLVLKWVENRLVRRKAVLACYIVHIQGESYCTYLKINSAATLENSFSWKWSFLKVKNSNLS